MALFKGEADVQLDKPAAEAFKAAHEDRLGEMQKAIDSLTGKDNKKERTAKSKELAELKVDKQYIDACKVTKGLNPVNGFFATVTEPEAPATATPSATAPPAEKLDPDAKKAA